MAENGFIGGVVGASKADQMERESARYRPSQILRWQWPIADRVGLIIASGDHCETFATADGGVMTRGYVGKTGFPNNISGSLKRLTAEMIWSAYRDDGPSSFERLEGSFTIVLIDKTHENLFIFRNLVGTGSTFYTETTDGILFAGNLRRLVLSLDGPLEPNQRILPVFFAFRTIPGPETLFDGVRKVLPGQLMRFDGGLARLAQLQYFRGNGMPNTDDVDAVARLESVMEATIGDCHAIDSEAGNLLSGGLDSSYIQAHFNRHVNGTSQPPSSFDIAVDHERTHADQQYAISASRWLNTSHRSIYASGSYEDYLVETISVSGEPPNHVQSAYFLDAARQIVGAGIKTVLCGEGADSLLGSSSVTSCIRAHRIKRWIPSLALVRWLMRASGATGRTVWRDSFRLACLIDDESHPDHLVNQVAAFMHQDSIERCFDKGSLRQALAYRRELLESFGVEKDLVHRVHAIGFLGEAMETASLWSNLFEHAGARMICPFMDSRVIRTILNLESDRRFVYRRPKQLLKDALGRYVDRELINRPKLGFGQPIFEWMSSNGQLRAAIDQINDYDFVDRDVLRKAKLRPNWFLYSLLCYDIWFKLFIEKSR